LVTEEQRERGFQTEDHFFDVVRRSRDKYPAWLIKVERANPLLDYRGIDGFAYVRRYVFFWRRVPLQIKSHRSQMEYDVRANKPVFVLSHRHMEPRYVLRNLFEQLEKARRLRFTECIRRAEGLGATPWELQRCSEITESRRKYRR